MAKTKYAGFVPKDDPMFSEGWSVFGTGKLNSTSLTNPNEGSAESDTFSLRIHKIDWSYFFGRYFTQAIINSEMRSKLIEELGEEFPYEKYFDNLSESEQFYICAACCEVFKKYSIVRKEILSTERQPNELFQLKELNGIFCIVLGENEHGLFESKKEAETFALNKFKISL